MKNLVRTTAFIFLIFTIIPSCTKEIDLKTEVEFSVTEQHKASGYTDENLSTTITVVPEEILEEFSYSYSYSVTKGKGHFQDRAGEIFLQNEDIALNPLSATMMYVGSESGDHIVKITATDNYGFTEHVEIDYSIAEIPPIVWTATSPVKRIELGNSAQITVNFEKSEANTEVNYERRYRVVDGSGVLTILSAETVDDLSVFQPILPGTFTLNFTPQELGIMQLSFDLKGDDGKEFTAELSFEVLEEIVDTVPPEIILLGDNPLTIEMGSTYVDLGATATDDVDGDITENILIDASELNTSVVGSYEVTYNVRDSSNNTASEVIRTIVVVAGDIPLSANNDILAFAIPGQEEAAIINEVAHTIFINVPFGTTVNVAPIVLSISPDADVSPSQGETQNFENPVIYIVTAENGNQQEWTITVSIIESDEKSIERFTIDGVDGLVTATEVTLTLPAGTDASTLTAQIAFVGTGIAPLSGGTIDFTNPVIYTVTAENGSTKDYSVTVIVEQSDDKEITSYVMEGVQGVFSGPALTNITVTLPTGTDEKSLAPTIIHTGETVNPQSGGQQDYTNPVTHTVTAENGTQKTYTIVVFVENDTPVASASASSGMVNTGQTINFSGSLSLDDITIASYIWDFGDGNFSTTINPLHTYSLEGTYEVVLTVTDDGGLTDTATLSVTVLPNEPPVAVASSDKTSGPNILTVNFSGSGSTDDMGIISYSWDFGDGTSSTQINPSHDFAVTGNYDVILTISDGQYTATDNISIRVDAFNKVTGRYSAPAGSLVQVEITSLGSGKGSANLMSHAGSSQSGIEFLSLSTSWNGISTGSSGFLDSAQDNFNMPSSGVVYFYGRHGDVIDVSQTYISISNSNGSPYNSNPVIKDGNNVQ